MKKITAAIFICILMFAAAVCAQADGLGFETGNSLPSATFKKPYSTTIKATGGSGNYTYSVDASAYIPAGLSLNEDGTLSGTPQEGGRIYSNLRIAATDTESGETVTKSFSLSIKALKLQFVIGKNNYTFDGMPKTVTAEPYLDGEKVDGISYEVKVGGEDTQTNVGGYPIKINVKTPGYKMQKMSASHMFINYNENVKIDFSGGTEYAFTGTQKSPSVSVTGKITDESDWENIAHTVHYEGLDVSYSSSEAPSLPGTYRLSVAVTENGFATPSDHDIQFTINRETVNFNISDNSPFYKGETWNRTYNADKSLTEPFEIKYVQNNIEYDAPISGTYSVRITLSDEDAVYYGVGTVSPATVTVQQRTVAATVTNTSKQYTGSGLLPDISTIPDLQLGTDYDIILKNQDTTDTADYSSANKPVNSGTYDYTISLADGSSYSMTPVTGTFTITPVTVKFTVSPVSYVFDNTVHTPVITTEPEGLAADKYTVKFTQNGVETPVQAVGEYDVDVAFTDTKNYVKSDESTAKISVIENTINFDIQTNSFTYGDGLDHKAVVTATDSDNNNFTDFTVTYTNQDTNDTKTYTDTDMPQNAGIYDIHIDFTESGYSQGTVTGSTTLTIAKKTITFTASKTEFDYTGSDIDPSSVISASPDNTGAAYTIVYHKDGSSDDLTALSEVGSYTSEIRFTSPADANNYQAVNSIGTLKVTAEKINFTITNTTYTYDASPHKADVIAEDKDNNSFNDFTVTYTNQDASDSTVYTESAPPTHAGTYNINIALNDLAGGYEIGTVTGSAVLTISQAELAFSVKAGTNEYIYDGAPHTAEIVTEPTVPNNTFEATYKKQGSDIAPAENATDAGIYDILISLDNSDYKLTDSAALTLTINPREVTFTVTGSPAKYKAEGNNAVVTLNPLPEGVPDPSFTVTYTNQYAGDTTVYTTSNPPVNIGTYNINIALPDNYVLNETYTFEIESSAEMNYGNSPAAMIYLDAAHSDDKEWQQAALNSLKNNRYFDEEHVPENCSKDIVYPIMISSQFDFDIDPYTVLVPYSINNFEDPGYMNNGTKLTGTVSNDLIPAEDRSLSIDGMYLVTYKDEHNNVLGTRFAVVVMPIGDASSDEVVNGIDANVIKKYYQNGANTMIVNAFQARSWDVNKDGRITSDDETAVVYRFRNKLKPYYPWLAMQ